MSDKKTKEELLKEDTSFEGRAFDKEGKDAGDETFHRDGMELNKKTERDALERLKKFTIRRRESHN